MKESAIQLKILHHLQAKGIFCWRQNNGATYDPKLRDYRFNPSAKKGVPDILGILPTGQFLGVECKSPTGKLSADQVIFKKRVEANGGVYIVARSLKDVDNLFEKV